MTQRHTDASRPWVYTHTHTHTQPQTHTPAQPLTCKHTQGHIQTSRPPWRPQEMAKWSHSPLVPKAQLPVLSLYSTILLVWRRTVSFFLPFSSRPLFLPTATLRFLLLGWPFPPPHFSPFCPSLHCVLPLLASTYPSLSSCLSASSSFPPSPFPPPFSPLFLLHLSLCSGGDMTSRASKSHISTKSYLQPSEGCVHTDTQTLSRTHTEVNTDTRRGRHR